MKTSNPTELLTHSDGSIYHLRLKPGDIAPLVFLVGDPARVEIFKRKLDNVELSVKNRDYHTITGRYEGQRITVMSTGIGLGNMDIAMTELDALVNVNFETLEKHPTPSQLTLIRIGTSGALQDDIPLYTPIVTESSFDLSGTLKFYAGVEEETQPLLTNALLEHIGAWLAPIYAFRGDKQLYQLFTETNGMVGGMTACAPGFYGAQGRTIRLSPRDKDLPTLLSTFHYDKHKFVNYEMESAYLYGMARLLKHRALCICLAITQRISEQATVSYEEAMDSLINKVLTMSTRLAP